MRRRSNKAVSWRRLDALCRRLVVELRDKLVCQRCGLDSTKRRLEWAHVVNRQAKSIQWKPWNTLALCGPRSFKQTCHYWFDSNKSESLQWWREQWPERARCLDVWRHEKRRQPIDLEMELAWLEQEIERAENS